MYRECRPKVLSRSKPSQSYSNRYRSRGCGESNLTQAYNLPLLSCVSVFKVNAVKSVMLDTESFMMPDLHSNPAGSRPDHAARNNGPDHLALERFKIRELAEGWPCYR